MATVLDLVVKAITDLQESLCAVTYWHVHRLVEDAVTGVEEGDGRQGSREQRTFTETRKA